VEVDMPFNLSFDSTVGAVQQAALQTVANFFNAHFTDPATIDISVSFANLGPGGLGASSFSLVTHNFSDITTALTNDSTSADDATAVASLPGTDPVTGTHTWTMTPAEEMALGLIPDNGTASDGSVRFSNTATFDFDRTDGIAPGAFDFFGVVAHEFTEIMGRELNAVGNTVASGAGDHPLDLFKFSAAGAREFVGTNAGYFSIDGGATNLDNFNTATNGDFGDWAASAGNDSFLAFSSSGVVNFVSLTDLRVMDVIGWQVAETAPVVTALSAAVGEDGPTLSQGLLTGTSDADNDILFVQNLDASVTTVSTSTLTQTLFLGSDYTLSGSTISLTPTGFAKFNGLSLGEHDTATFNYGVSDGITTTPNTLTLTINGLNDNPTAAAIAGNVNEDGPAQTLLAAFTDPDRDDTHSFSIDTTGTKGNVTNNNDGTFSYDPNGQFNSLGLGQTATDTFAYIVTDNHGASSTATATITVIGQNDAPVIQTGGAGDEATYWVRVHNAAITTVHATDVDNGDVVTYSIVGGKDASSFTIDADTGVLAFASLPKQPHNAYTLQVQASDGHPGGTDIQTITVNVTADKMAGDPANLLADTFVFHDKFGANTVQNFDPAHDFLQFDRGMFSADTAAAVLDASHDDHHGNVVVDTHAGHLTLQGVSLTQLASHSSDFLFV
jgi:VCBS repeat-containing protein